ncbi:MAG: SMC-Scp complex subunit ScpB [candidate division NC10 bacterium]|nr:SMC-Scp complex subunit ScpB [candidate division NC10 bacterium]
MSPEPVAALEALLFASPDPLPRERLGELLPELSAEELAAALAALRTRYASPESGLMVDEVAGGFRLATRPEVADTLARLTAVRPSRLSRPALETLAIIAYRQPITKAEVEAVRGVNIDGVLKTLGERGLIRILGRKREPGRPMLYGTSKDFLEYFGFQDLSELPTLREIEALVASPQAPRPMEYDPLGEPEPAGPPVGPGPASPPASPSAAAPKGRG